LGAKNFEFGRKDIEKKWRRREWAEERIDPRWASTPEHLAGESDWCDAIFTTKVALYCDVHSTRTYTV